MVCIVYLNMLAYMKCKICMYEIYLPCLTTMSDSLLTSQCLRLLTSGDSKSVAHLDYWLGSLVADILPGLGLGREAVKTHEHFEKVADCVALAMMSETLALTLSLLVEIT